MMQQGELDNRQQIVVTWYPGASCFKTFFALKPACRSQSQKLQDNEARENG